MRSFLKYALIVLAAAPGLCSAAEPDPALEKLRADAAAVTPLVNAGCVRQLLGATAALPGIETRTLYIQRDPKAVYTEDEAAKLPEEQRAKLVRRDFDTARYYDTFYG